MTTPISLQQLKDASRDAADFGTFVNAASGNVTPRLGTPYPTAAQAVANVAGLIARGDWLTATVYVLRDLVKQSGVTYICLVGHTSGTFATDLAAGRWAIYQGVSGNDLASSDPTKGAALVGYGASNVKLKLDNLTDFIGNSQIIYSHLLSYTGFLADPAKWSTDNGTRFYILPPARVTSGVGGAIKIFGDAYHLGADYRDFGLYFSQNQNSDSGYYGTGVFWNNCKVGPNDTSLYGYQSPDIGWSFQDGQVVAGRISRYGGGTANDRACWIIGSTIGVYSPTLPTVGMEFVNKDLLFHNNRGIRLVGAGGVADNLIICNASNNVQVTVGGSLALEVTPTKQLKPAGPVISKGKSVTTNVTTVSATDADVIVFGQPAANSVTDFTGGTAYQELTLIFSNGNTTIVNGAPIRLAGGVNFVGTANDVLTLIYTGSAWYEKSRSVN